MKDRGASAGDELAANGAAATVAILGFPRYTSLHAILPTPTERRGILADYRAATVTRGLL